MLFCPVVKVIIIIKIRKFQQPIKNKVSTNNQKQTNTHTHAHTHTHTHTHTHIHTHTYTHTYTHHTHAGDHFVIGSVSRPNHKTLRMYDSVSMSVVYECNTVNSVLTVAFAPDGARFGAGLSNGSVVMYDRSKMELPMWTACRHTKEVLAVAFSASGTHVATSSRDKTVIVHMAESGLMIAGPLTGATDWVTSLAYTPNNMLVCGSADDTVRVYIKAMNYSDVNFSSRSRDFKDAKRLNCVAAAPAQSAYAGLVAIGTGAGKIYFLDTTLLDQQPTYSEAIAVIQHDRDFDSAEFDMTQAMVTRYPFVVNSSDKDGFSLYHHAVVREVGRCIYVCMCVCMCVFVRVRACVYVV